MKTLRCALSILAVIAIASLLAPAARATSFSVDQSDLYWIPAESGWGMQLVQRKGTIFATLFVYDTSTNPTWFVAVMDPTATPLQWTGDLYATTGPWFGTVPFNSANVTETKAGTMTWTAQTVATGNVSYTVNGVAVSKNVIRQTLVNENYSGHFGGGIHQTTTGCANPSVNRTVEAIGVIDISESGGTVTIEAGLSSGACSYAGTLTQFGQMGDIVGSFLCTDGGSGTFHIFQLQITDLSVVGRFDASYVTPAAAAGCKASGWFGGTTITTF